MKVLIVEDETKVLNFVKNGLSSAEMSVDAVKSIDEMFSNMMSIQYDVIVLDRLLNGVDSVRYIADVRKKSPSTKIIILSALSDVEDKVAGLTQGADDYLGKPFNMTELIARIRSLTRRSEGDANSNLISYEDLVIKLDSQRVEREGKKLDLTAKEYKLLVLLAKNPNKIYSKSQLLDHVWELQYYPESNVVEVVINHLRGKLDKEFSKPLLQSRRGTGYWIGTPDL
ncbi:MAG: hypothetical protein ACD_73C00729G0003 [uncultured bacterium]|nr:MAG: hypothetical protein ACD_73C00729G0003 [uncultured bacterium]